MKSVFFLLVLLLAVGTAAPTTTSGKRGARGKTSDDEETSSSKAPAMRGKGKGRGYSDRPEILPPMNSTSSDPPPSEDDEVYAKGKGKSGGSKNQKKKSMDKKGGQDPKTRCPKGRKRRGSKSSKGPITDVECENFDFTDKVKKPSRGKDRQGQEQRERNGGKGKGSGSRLLQVGAEENCSPNTIEIASGNSNLAMFVELVEAAGLADVFNCTGPFTVFAPTNEAFAALPAYVRNIVGESDKATLQELVLYHVAPGASESSQLLPGCIETLQGDYLEVSIGPILLNGDARVSQSDVAACNAVIHLIDEVLIPPSFDVPSVPEVCDRLDFSGVARRLQFGGDLCEGNVLEIARQDADFASFVSLVEEANLSDMFLCAGPFTALIPTNSAFMALEIELGPSQLVEMLLYHLVAGVQLSTDLMAGSLPTLQGSSVTVTANPIAFDGIAVVETDTIACNGVIHKMESVLIPTNLPEESTPVPISPPTAPAPTEPTPATPVVPTPPTPPATPPPDGAIRVRVADYYISYVVPSLSVAPPEVDVTQLLSLTADFWRKFFQMSYAGNEIVFQDIVLSIDESLYNAGIPDADFNFYVNFDTEVLYDANSATPPGAAETFTLMRSANFTSYILDYVRTVPSLTTTNEIDFRAIEMSAQARSNVAEGTKSDGTVSSFSVPAVSAASAFIFVSALAALVVVKRRRTQKNDLEGSSEMNLMPGDYESDY